MAKPIYLKDETDFEKKLESSLKKNFSKNMSVAVKLHMGEGKGMFNPNVAKRAVSILLKLGCKPFLIDTPVVYPGPRHYKWGYEKTAMLHGFSESKIGCPIVISDEYVTVKTTHMNVEVSKHLAEADALLVLTHVKGHDCAGFGGAIKNLAMGGVSPKSKGEEHGFGKPTVIVKNCTACKACEKVCGFNAIKVKDKAEINHSKCVGCDNCVYACPHHALEAKVLFDTLLAEAAFAVLKALKKKPVYYVNDVRKITKHCDCFPFPGESITKDVGLVLCDDILEVERKSLNLIDKQEGKNFFKLINHHDPYLQIEELERLLKKI